MVGPARCSPTGWTGCRSSAVRRLVPVSGTATTVAAAALKLPSYDPARIHLSRIPAEQVHKVAAVPAGRQPVPPGRARATCTRAGSTSSAAAR